MTVSYEFRRYIPIPHNNVDALFNRAKAEEWCQYRLHILRVYLANIELFCSAPSTHCSRTFHVRSSQDYGLREQHAGSPPVLCFLVHGTCIFPPYLVQVIQHQNRDRSRERCAFGKWTKALQSRWMCANRYFRRLISQFPLFLSPFHADSMIMLSLIALWPCDEVLKRYTLLRNQLHQTCLIAGVVVPGPIETDLERFANELA